MFGAAGWYDHSSVLARARDTAVATTHALAEHAEAVMQTATLALDLQTQCVDGMSWTEIDHSRAVHEFLVGLTRQLPQLQSAFFVDPNGFNSVSSRAFPMHPYDDRDREYFQAAIKGRFGLLITAPFHGQAAGTDGFVVSRARLTDGHFDGIVAVTLSPDYFRDFYESVLAWHRGASAALLRRDGTVLVRYPTEPRLAYKIDADRPIMRALASSPDSGTGESRAQYDGREKLFAYRTVHQSDLVVLYTLDLQQVLAEWYQHLVIFAAFAVLASIALLLTAGRAMEQAAREQAGLQVLLDETERRQRAEMALQQAAKLEALGRLTGGVAHDFNNLLAAVLGSLELALRRVQDARLTRQLTIAQQAAQRGARLTAQMLAFARKQIIAPRSVAVNDLIRDADELLRRACGGAMQVDYDLEHDLWRARADPTQLELVLLNLVTNARDAMRDGGAVTFITRNVPPEADLPPGLARRDYVSVAVRDTGSGMAEEVRRSAFEPFFTTKGPGRGTGLGLSMVHGFAHQLGGTVTLDSEPGRGTTVTVFLPRAEHDAEDSEAPSTDPARHLEVLLVDDDVGARASARDMLVELGHNVAEAPGGEPALELLQARHFDLLVADFAMPGMNGAELADAASRLVPDLPIVFVTGYAGDDMLRSWLARGCLVVEKPFSLDKIAAVLRRVSPAISAC
jgi:two-component system NtrC family sensor kinase